MRVLIVDDEPLARGRLRAMVEEIGGHQVVGEAGSGTAALAAVAELCPELLLLDIRMPGIDGLEVARHLAALAVPPAVIFTTAYGEHALEAFDAQAVDYLLKPIRRERLEQALARAQQLSGDRLGALQAAAGETRHHIATRLGERLELIPLATIGCFVAEHKYVTLYHQGGEAVTEEPLKALESEFGGAFLRIHRNALVARGRIAGLEREGDGHVVIVRGIDHRPQVSRRHLAEVRQAIKALG